MDKRFLKCCGGKGPTVMITKAKDTNAVFGGYTNIRWEKKNNPYDDDNKAKTGDGSTFLYKMLDDNSCQKFKHAKGAEVTHKEGEILFGNYPGGDASHIKINGFTIHEEGDMINPGCYASLFSRVFDDLEENHRTYGKGEEHPDEPDCFYGPIHFDTSEIDHLDIKTKVDYLSGGSCYLPTEIEVFQVITASGDTGIAGDDIDESVSIFS
jgi:hypothetical protein